MVSAKPIQVQINSDRDAMAAIEAVYADGLPREVERDGKVLALILPYLKELDDCTSTQEKIDVAFAIAARR